MELAGMLLHDLRTPLTTILLQCELLESRRPEAGRTVALARLRRNAERLASLVEDLSAVVLLEQDRLSVAPEPVEVRGLVDAVVDALAPVAERRGVQLGVAGGPAGALADPRRVGQVLTNLVGNALKFTGPGGSVEVEVRPAGTMLQVEVRDTGAGFRPEQAQELFRPFTQLEEGRRLRCGTGLGLHIAREIVERHGGAVGARSAGPGQGATFWFTLPAHPAAA